MGIFRQSKTRIKPRIKHCKAWTGCSKIKWILWREDSVIKGLWVVKITKEKEGNNIWVVAWDKEDNWWVGGQKLQVFGEKE